VHIFSVFNISDQGSTNFNQFTCIDGKVLSYIKDIVSKCVLPSIAYQPYLFYFLCGRTASFTKVEVLYFKKFWKNLMTIKSWWRRNMFIIDFEKKTVSTNVSNANQYFHLGMSAMDTELHCVNQSPVCHIL
jgi:hypothetical protein